MLLTNNNGKTSNNFRKIFLKLLLVLPFTQSLSYAQKKHIILDSLDKKPVEFALIYCSGNSTYSDNFGFFSIECENKKEIYISRVGYKLKKINNYIIKDTIYLESISTINEVIVKEKRRKNVNTVQLGFINEKTTGTFLAESEAALLITNPYGTLQKINSVKFTFSPTKFLGKKPTNSISYIVRLRVYNIGSQGQPNNDLLQKNITAIVNKRQTSVQFDIQNENIYLPIDGCFISVEFIGFIDEWKKFTAKDGKDIYNHKIQFTPRFIRGNQKPQSWFKVKVNGPWRKMYDVEGNQPNFKFGIEITQ